MHRGAVTRRKEASMPDMGVWDWVLLFGAAYIAVTSLVILMRRRRDEVLAELDAQVERERKRQRAREDSRSPKSRKAA
jgi:heme exporter protein D